ncbi:hypothetical protein QVD17_05498 [Tagetes erecta]|uniref:Uncharacterized protein n=1 Tax=Tagetes erecta TaxID=13708 RepID=A0AAD8LEH4_TARER|nr:hypothetical protein QVD17_05498 [Tagetes erecta]
MKAVAITIITFIFVVLAFTVLVTLCYKGNGDRGSDDRRGKNKIHKRATTGGQTGHYMESGVAAADNGMSNSTAVAAFTVVSVGDGGGGG